MPDDIFIYANYNKATHPSPNKFNVFYKKISFCAKNIFFVICCCNIGFCGCKIGCCTLLICHEFCKIMQFLCILLNFLMVY